MTYLGPINTILMGKKQGRYAVPHMITIFDGRCPPPVNMPAHPYCSNIIDKRDVGALPNKTHVRALVAARMFIEHHTYVHQASHIGIVWLMLLMQQLRFLLPPALQTAKLGKLAHITLGCSGGETKSTCTVEILCFIFRERISECFLRISYSSNVFQLVYTCFSLFHFRTETKLKHLPLLVLVIFHFTAYGAVTAMHIQLGSTAVPTHSPHSSP